MAVSFGFKTGDRVRHVSRDELGTVTILENGDVQVRFDKPTPKGRPSLGVYDAIWFRTYPNGLVALQQTPEA
jgi:hypothetical protein